MSGTASVDCARCGGTGEVRWLANPPDPQTEESARCPACNGEGQRPLAEELGELLVPLIESLAGKLLGPLTIDYDKGAGLWDLRVSGFYGRAETFPDALSALLAKVEGA